MAPLIPQSLEELLPSPGDMPAMRAALATEFRARVPKFPTQGGELSQLFRIYDEWIFGGWLVKALRDADIAPVRFRFSRRLTRSAGVTRRMERRTLTGRNVDFEIVIAHEMILHSFDKPGRTITVGGIDCHDPLTALMRVFEHELIHMLEYLLRGRSSCRGKAFHFLAGRIFGHSEFIHTLVTPAERARDRFGIQVGQRVSFRSESVRLDGKVRRITKRATVLVESPQGQRYSDGKRYEKYYVPLEKLACIIDR